MYPHVVVDVCTFTKVCAFCLWLYVHIFKNYTLRACVYICMYIYMSDCAYMCVYMYLYDMDMWYIFVNVYMCAQMHACTHVFVDRYLLRPSVMLLACISVYLCNEVQVHIHTLYILT